MKYFILTIVLLLSAETVFAHDFRRYGEYPENGYHQEYRRNFSKHEHRQRGEREWRHNRVVYQQEYRPAEQRIIIPLPPPLFLLPPFVFFR